MLDDFEIKILSDTFLFKNIEEKRIQELTGSMTLKVADYRKDECIFTPDSFRKELGIVLNGKIRVTKSNSLLVSELETGDLFGAAALFNSETTYVSTLTAKKDTKVIFFTQSDISTLIDLDNTARINYISYLSERIRFLSSKVDSLANSTAEVKLRSFILHRAQESPDLEFKCSMTDIAASINAGRATVYRELDKLEAEGIIIKNGKTIRVLKPELLGELL